MGAREIVCCLAENFDTISALFVVMLVEIINRVICSWLVIVEALDRELSIYRV